MIVAIHQPDFMPWMGFFDKILKADLWVILDHVENNPRNTGYWNRVEPSLLQVMLFGFQLV